MVARQGGAGLCEGGNEVDPMIGMNLFDKFLRFRGIANPSELDESNE